MLQMKKEGKSYVVNSKGYNRNKDISVVKKALY